MSSSSYSSCWVKILCYLYLSPERLANEGI
ncbi:chromosome partition protein MukE, partial [Escherichia sp. TWPC-MK]